jgi:hypothetical protein
MYFPERGSGAQEKGRNISVYRIAIEDDLGVLRAEMHGNGFTIAKK